MPRLKSSRRASGLQDSDYDHVIDLVDHDSPPPSPRPVSTNGVIHEEAGSVRFSEDQVRHSLSTSSGKGKGVQREDGRTASVGSADRPHDSGQASPMRAPSIKIQGEPPVPANYLNLVTRTWCLTMRTRGHPGPRARANHPRQLRQALDL